MLCAALHRRRHSFLHKRRCSPQKTQMQTKMKCETLIFPSRTTPFGIKKKPSWTCQLGPESRVHSDFIESASSLPSLPKKRVYYRVNSVRPSKHVNSDKSTSYLSSLTTLLLILLLTHLVWMYLKLLIIRHPCSRFKVNFKN